MGSRGEAALRSWAIGTIRRRAETGKVAARPVDRIRFSFGAVSGRSEPLSGVAAPEPEQAEAAMWTNSNIYSRIYSRAWAIAAWPQAADGMDVAV